MKTFELAKRFETNTEPRKQRTRSPIQSHNDTKFSIHGVRETDNLRNKSIFPQRRCHTVFVNLLSVPVKH